MVGVPVGTEESIISRSVGILMGGGPDHLAPRCMPLLT